MKNKTKLYFLSALTLTFLMTGLRTACLLTSYDGSVGYFSSTPLLLITKILYVLSAAWCLAAPLLLPKSEALAPRPAATRQITGSTVGTLFLFSGLCLLPQALTKAETMTKTFPALLTILACSALLSSVFFFTETARTPRMQSAHAYFGFAPLVFAFAFLFHVYFDMYVTINSPLKNAIQLSLLSAMLFILHEIRDSIGKPPLRISAAIRLVCALLCIPTAVSHLIFARSALCSPFEQNLLSPFLSLPLLALGIFALVKFPMQKDLAESEDFFQKPLDKEEKA